MGITLPFTRTRKNGAAPPAGGDDDEGAGPREPAAFHVPALEDVSPAYAERKRAYDDLARQHGERRAEVNQLISDLAKFGRQPPPSEREVAVQRLMGALIDPGAAEFGEKQRRYPEAAKEVAALAEAVDRMRRIVSDERNNASAIVRDLVRPLYAARVGAICEALLAVRDAQLAYHELVDELDAQNVVWTPLNPLPASFVGNPKDWQGRMALYLRECAKWGYLDEEKIPERMRPGGGPVQAHHVGGVPVRVEAISLHDRAPGSRDSGGKPGRQTRG